MQRAGEIQPSVRRLGLLDIVGLTVGSIVGADIYVASAFGSGRLGPASLILWALAGLIALIIALTFAQCAMYVPKVGGPYAYVAAAYGQLPGFLVGWALWIAEWTSLAVFPIAFARYLSVLFPGISPIEVALAKTAFVSFILVTNLYGARLAGTVNDLLTAFKLAPLVLLSVLGLLFLVLDPGTAKANLVPFAPKGLSTTWGDTLVLIFWAYAGFELATIPAGEVREPTRTVPIAIMIGMAMVTGFYLITNFVLLAVTPWAELARAAAPLTLGVQRLLGEIAPAWVAAGGLLMTVGAMVSIAGSNESGTLSTSRLAYAMAADGHLPKAFARLHPRFQTPYVALLFQNATALVAALVGTLGLLIRVTVFSLGLAYLFTSLAAVKLRHQAVVASPEHRVWVQRAAAGIPYLSALVSLFLLSQVGLVPALLGMTLLGVGLLVYAYLSPEKELEQLKSWLTSRRYQYGKVAAVGQSFLAWPLSLWRSRRLPRPPAPGWVAERVGPTRPFWWLDWAHPAADVEIGQLGEVGQAGERKSSLVSLVFGLIVVVALVGAIAVRLGDRTPSSLGQRPSPQLSLQAERSAGSSGPLQWAAWAQPYVERGIPILYYHQVSDTGPPSGLRVSVEEFRRQMEYLYTHGYRTISLDDLVNHLWPDLERDRGDHLGISSRAPTSPIGPKPVVITFDDGYLNVYTNAIPVLQRLGYTATIFVTTRRPWGQPVFLQMVPYMNAWHWRKLADAGFTIGSHTLTHATLTEIPLEQARQEIAHSRLELQRLLGRGRPVRYFAFPRGRCNDALLAEVARAGYLAALTTKRGVNTPTTPRFALRRLPVTGTMSLDDFARQLERLTASLPIPQSQGDRDEDAGQHEASASP